MIKLSSKQLRTLINEAIEHRPVGGYDDGRYDSIAHNLGGNALPYDTIDESQLNGVPEWQLRQDTLEYVDRIRQRIKQHILTNKSNRGSEQREAVAAMNEILDELEIKLYDVLEDSLYAFTRRV